MTGDFRQARNRPMSRNDRMLRRRDGRDIPVMPWSSGRERKPLPDDGFSDGGGSLSRAPREATRPDRRRVPAMDGAVDTDLRVRHGASDTVPGGDTPSRTAWIPPGPPCSMQLQAWRKLLEADSVEV